MAYEVEFVIPLGLRTTPQAFEQVILFGPSTIGFSDGYVVFSLALF